MAVVGAVVVVMIMMVMMVMIVTTTTTRHQRCSRSPLVISTSDAYTRAIGCAPVVATFVAVTVLPLPPMPSSIDTR